MFNIFKTISDLLKPEVWAIYIIGFSGFAITIDQLKRNFRLKKKSDTFEELSREIREASDLFRKIDGSTDSIISALATAANGMTFDSVGKDEPQIKAEIERRDKVLDELRILYQRHSSEINDSTLRVLNIIKNIEKSTVVKEKSRIAARYLYYALKEQDDLTKASNEILETMHVVPPIDDEPDISPDSFNAIRTLVISISDRNNITGGYLDDLEIILHNDLVKRIYKKAKNQTTPVRHITSVGIIDIRTKEPLL